MFVVTCVSFRNASLVLAYLCGVWNKTALLRLLEVVRTQLHTPWYSQDILCSEWLLLLMAHDLAVMTSGRRTGGQWNLTVIELETSKWEDLVSTSCRTFWYVYIGELLFFRADSCLWGSYWTPASSGAPVNQNGFISESNPTLRYFTDPLLGPQH
jgi:hypothetical protein